MAPPKKRPPQGRAGQKRPQQGNKPPQARKPAGAEPSAPEGTEEAQTDGVDEASEGAAASSEPLSKAAEERKAKREAARLERIAIARKRQQAKKRKQILISVVLLVAIGAGTVFAVNRARGQSAALAAAVEEAGCTDINSFEDEGQNHLAPNETFTDYQTNPPTSGPHRAQPAPWGSYRDAPEQETLVHNLEHGGIVIHYKDLSDADVDRIDAFADSYDNGVISAPNPNIETPVAFAAWRHHQTCEELNFTVIEGFISDRCNKGPEKVGVTCIKR